MLRIPLKRERVASDSLFSNPANMIYCKSVIASKKAVCYYVLKVIYNEVFEVKYFIMWKIRGIT